MPCPVFPPLYWWAELRKHQPDVLLSVGDAVTDGVPLSRYGIATANGQMQLSIPLKGGRKSKAALQDRLIDYTHDWQRQHWGAIYSAYGRAPFFEYYGREMKAMLFSRHQRLLDFNLAGLEWLIRSFRLTTSLVTTSEASTAPSSKPDEGTLPLSYHQVFEERWGFLPGLSAIDLLMNEGPYSAEYF